MKKILLSILGLLITFTTFAQTTRAISGKVTAVSDGLPLPGVTVSVKGSTVGTQTDAQGAFRLNVPNTATTLVFKYIGYKQLEAPISASMNIQLQEDQKQLSEVVVVGYGTQYKQDVTGSAARVSSKDFENQPLPSFETALQGRAAGVYINSGSGKLGQGINIRIRGTSSISAGSEPLFVIDGIPVTTANLTNQGEAMNPLADINPDDIESIDILKDAASAAIYGARGSNGVVLVTTKKGKVGKSKVTFGYAGGFSRPSHYREFLNAAQYRDLFTAAATNMGYDPAEEFNGESGTDDWNKNFDTNWNREAFRTGNNNQYNFSVNGGDQKTLFLLSGTYNDQKGMIIGNRFKRTSGRVNLDHSVNDKFKIGANLSLTKSDNYRVAADNEFSNPVQLNALPPLHPKYDPVTGELNSATIYYNNLIDLDNSSNLQTNYHTISSSYASYTLAKGLVARSEFGVDLINLKEDQYKNNKTLDGGKTGFGFSNSVRALNYTSNNTLNYSATFNEKHNLQLLGAFTYQEGNTQGASSSAQGFPNNKFTKIDNAAVITAGTSNETAYTFVSYITRANYKFNDRYLVGASVRVDGSSRFGKNQKYGTFPAASLGWIASEEDFLKDSKYISFLKVRGSYGVTGNAEIGNFASRTLYGSINYGDQAGIRPTQLGFPDLSWESKNTLDLGLDYGFFNGRLTGEFDYYTSKTKDLLLNIQLPATNGFSTITKNIGNLNNKGFEVSVTSQNFVGGPFTWSTTANFSHNKNKITNMEGQIITGGSRQLGSVREGQPYGIFYGKKYAGVDPANGDALYYKADGTTTNDYAAADEQVVGDPNPKFIGGLGNKFSFKGFDLDVQTQFVYGNDLYNIAGFFQSVNGDYFDNQTVDQLKYWKNPGDITKVPQPRLYEGNGAGKSSRWVEDGSYFRLKSATLSYNLPKTLVSRLRLENARIYVAGANLFTWTKYSGYDPEVNATYVSGVNVGHDFYTPPQARTITFGFNVGL